MGLRVTKTNQLTSGAWGTFRFWGNIICCILHFVVKSTIKFVKKMTYMDEMHIDLPNVTEDYLKE